ncbi:RagB/SusD family nutrient uptake outer membrane protein [Sphingobacterium siyangense]|uniref:RagB/SusD family nutrient uptake outer membrane protein n=1 Tax=Sphingobacterium siyangense TaxID=459529 RepID=UPI001965A0B5|nr:RagB/SusD family nutrient uptake outer membrane protein [Sphingobacterium siyangense]QRY55565.1 RagB/SusD family nutrient uptake outer membrane protein [Sphingobacterium siyangense]
MKNLKRYIISGLTIILCLCSGCSKFVTIDPPKHQMVSATIFSSDETAIAALMGMYSTMQVNKVSYLIPLYTGLSGDELYNWSTLSTHRQMYQNALQPIDAASNQIWNLSYNIIYQANAIIEGCNSSEILTPAVKQQLLGEALFVRAYWHFYLLNLFGEVPLVLTTNYETNANLGREDETTIYDQIILDLKEAKERLSNDYVALNSISASTERIRPNKAVASAFMARVYLFREDFANAALLSTQVIDNTADYRIEPVNTAFLVTGKEAIWQLAMPTPTANNPNTWEGSHFILERRPMNNAFNSSTVSGLQLEDFEKTDQRKANWISSFTDATVEPNVTYYYPNKYRILNSTSILERTIVLRLAEQYLIRAEARARSIPRNLEGAKDDLNVIRNRAGLPLLSLSELTPPEVALNYILKERRSELFAEWGHRWMDLRRTGKINPVMQTVATYKGTTWSSSAALWPIPQQEVERNSKLGQK